MKDPWEEALHTEHPREKPSKDSILGEKLTDPNMLCMAPRTASTGGLGGSMYSGTSPSNMPCMAPRTASEGGLDAFRG
jgi:hypothetical protein